MRTFALLLSTLLLAACSTPQTGLDGALARYNDQDYESSYALAEDAAEHATSVKESREAAYLAGMSAYRLEKYDDAARWLTDASRSTDAWTAGQAGVMLGNTRLKQHDPAGAARAFADAAERLEGDEARKAHIAAGNAYREANNQRGAEEQFRLANVPTTRVADAPAPLPAAQMPKESTTPTVTAAPAPTGPFVIQAGAFREEAKARRRALELKSKAVKAGLGEPRILTKRGADGSTLWVVQIGGFADRRAADNALDRLGSSGLVVGRAMASADA